MYSASIRRSSQPKRAGRSMFTLFDFKCAIILFIVFGTLSALHFWWERFIIGAYYMSAGLFPTLLGAAAPFIILAVAFSSIHFLINLTEAEVEKFLEWRR